MEDNSQSETPESVPGTVPQGVPAVLPGPGQMRLPQPEQGQERDWEASFKGLMSTYTKEKDEWRKERQQFTETMGQVVGRLEALEKHGGQPPAQAPEPQGSPPTPSPQGSQAEQDNSALYDRLAEMEAERYRDQLLLQYVEPGAPGQGLPLLTFRDQIRVFAPELDDSGNVNDAAQRAEIEGVIKKLQALRGQTMQVASAGWTPGSTLEPPRQPSREEKVKRYYEVKDLLGSDALLKLPQAEQSKIEDEYYALHEELGWDLPHQTMPFQDFKVVDSKIQRLVDRMGVIESRMRT